MAPTPPAFRLLPVQEGRGRKAKIPSPSQRFMFSEKLPQEILSTLCWLEMGDVTESGHKARWHSGISVSPGTAPPQTKMEFCWEKGKNEH